MWQKLREEESGDGTSTDDSHDNHTTGQRLEQTNNGSIGGTGISNEIISPVTVIKPAIDMSIANVSFNINKIRELIGATDNLANEMYRQKQNGWGAKASEIASQLKTAYTNLQAAALSAEDALAARMDEDFNNAVVELEKAKRELRFNQTSQVNTTTNANNLAEGQQKQLVPDVTVVISNVDQGQHPIDADIVRGVPMEDPNNAKSKLGAKRARGQD